jgi:hypothetical protein
LNPLSSGLHNLPSHLGVFRKDSRRPTTLRPGVIVQGDGIGDAFAIVELMHPVDLHVLWAEPTMKDLELDAQ